MSLRRVPIGKAYSTKLEPEEPWRYVCPDCGTSNVERHKENRNAYCRGCNIKIGRVYDKKKGVLVDTEEI